MKDNIDILQKAIVDTLSNKDLNLDIITLDELKDILLIPHVIEITDNIYWNSISKLQSDKKIYLDDGFVSLKHDDFTGRKQQYIKNKKTLNKDIQIIKKDFSFVFDKLDVLSICIDLFSYLNNFEQSSGTRIVNLYVLEDERAKPAYFKAYKAFLRVKRRSVKYNIRSSNNVKELITVKNKNLKSAFHILNVKPVFNRNSSYEKFIYNQMWVFDIFKNYPMRKISMGYKI